MPTQLIVDSASDLDAAYARQNDVTIVPLRTIFPDGEYLQGVNMTAGEFYEKLAKSAEIPCTSQATPFEFERVFDEVVASGDEAVVITLSSKLSGTYESARAAASKHPGRIFAVDSLSVSIGEHLLVERALALRDSGAGASEIAEALEKERGDIRVIAALDTLEYLQKGGRISSAVAVAGNLLSIKPVIAIVEGEVQVIGKARGPKKSNDLLRSKVSEAGGINFDKPFRLGYTGLSDSMLRKYVRDSEDRHAGHVEDELKVTHIGSVIGTHAGPGAVAIAFFGK